MRVVRLYGVSHNLPLAPRRRADEEVWCLNYHQRYRFTCKRVLGEWTRWFNLHSPSHMQRTYPEGVAWYRTQTKPIYLQEVDPTIPGSVAFPREAVQRYFGANGQPQRYFTCSNAWLMALAILEGFDRIELWGHQMQKGAEYAAQRPCFFYWIEEARRRGIEVIIPPASLGGPDASYGEAGDPTTYTGPLYGYETS
jgi:hypothetical protein